MDKLSIEKTLEECIPPKGTLYEAARYALFPGGKRIRPRFLLATVEMLGGPLEAAHVPACALECIHTYSLIHDDLPCMDDDDFRRGKPSVHKVYGEGNAVLVGDFLLTHAFELLSSAPHLTNSQRIALIQAVSAASGGEGMVGGQVHDLAGSAPLTQLHAMKTGALFRAALVCGGIIAHAPTRTAEALRALGERIGFLFQVVDDIDDGEHGYTLADAEEAHHECLEIISLSPTFETLLTSILPKKSLSCSNVSQ